MLKFPRMLRLAGYALMVLLATLAHYGEILNGIELPFLDAQMRLLRQVSPRSAHNDVIVVGFDEPYIDKAVEPFALFHPHLAAIVDAMRLAAPKLLAFDIALPDKSFHALVPRDNPDYDFDQTLLRAIGLGAREFPIILARTLDENGKRLRDVHAPFLAAANRSPFLPQGLAASGSAVLCTDHDEAIRRYPDHGCGGIQSLLPLAAAMAAVQGNRQEWSGLIDYTVGAPFQVVPARDVIAAAARGDGEWLKTRFAGRVVLVGIVFRDEDRHVAPVSLLASEPNNRYIPGLVLQAQIYRSLMNHGLATAVNGWPLMLAVAAAALFWFGATTWRKLVALLALSAMVAAMAVWLLTHLSHLPVVGVLVTAWFAFAARAMLSAYESWRERTHLEATFSGYVSPQLMKRLQSGEISPSQRGTKANVCVLFSDICGFTTLSEQLPPEQVVELLNEYFAVMTDAIHRHGGVVDKFIGDGIMALFGQPAPLPVPERAALEAAHEMIIRLEQLNRERFSSLGIHITSGIGIHSGEAVLGFLGSKKRHDFTAIGDTVNTASRIESLTRSLAYPIVCSGGIANAVGNPDFLVDLGMQKIKGHTDIRVYGWKPELSVGRARSGTP